MNRKMLMLMAGSSRRSDRQDYVRDIDRRSGSERQGRMDGTERMDMNYPMLEPYGGYLPPTDKFRDRRGREHYDNGQFAPMNNTRYDIGHTEHRDIGMDRGSDYARSKNDYDVGMAYPYVPPVYERGEHYKQNDGPNMRRIGFRIGGEMEPLPPELESEYQSYADYRRVNEGDYHRGKDAQMGRASGKSYGPMTYEMAKEWVDQMENEDGTKGPHWSLEQIKNIAAQKGLDCDPVHLWATMNMMYSDYCKTFKKFGVGDKLDFYIEMSKAFLDDKDAQPDKLTRYFKCIAE